MIRQEILRGSTAGGLCRSIRCGEEGIWNPRRVRHCRWYINREHDWRNAYGWEYCLADYPGYIVCGHVANCFSLFEDMIINACKTVDI
jgi:hypothetical protein